MERVIHFDADDIKAARSTTFEQRIRQANAAFRLFHALHKPYKKPFVRGFDSYEELHAFEKEHDLPR